MPEPVDIEEQHDLLRRNRRNLARYLQQQADQGGIAFVQPGTANSIENACAEISRIKAILRKWGEFVEDLPNESPPGSPSASHSSLLADLATLASRFSPAVQLIDLGNVRPATAAQLNNYYAGVQLTWGVIAADGVVRRQQQNDLIELLSRPRVGLRMLCLTGEPGSGKTTLAWRLAAEYAKQLNQPVIQLRDSGAHGINDALWALESVASTHGAPLVVLVDDIFRDSDTRQVLGLFHTEIDLTIIATSRSNELPGDLVRLPFEVKTVRLMPPNDVERADVLQKLNLDAGNLQTDQLDRLQQANSWLVMMLELTTGEALKQIVYGTVTQIKQRDPIVYAAYEYLCFVGQYDLAFPSSLMEALHERGEFYDLLHRPASEQIIFEDQQQQNHLRTLHSLIARESLKMYHRDRFVLLRDIMRAAQPDLREHRLLIAKIFRMLLLDHQPALVRRALEANQPIMQALLTNSGLVELVHRWPRIYRQLDDRVQAEQLEAIALEKTPETHTDWDALLYLVQHQDSRQKIATIIDAAAVWLAANPDDGHVRHTYIGLITRKGTPAQVARVLDMTADWLAAHPQNVEVRRVYLALIAQKGTPEQVAGMLDATAEWLDAHPRDVEVRRAYLGLVEQKGTPAQVARVLDVTAAWLAIDSDVAEVRREYLGLVVRNGTPAQVARVLDVTAEWLDAHPRDVEVRRVYLGVIAQKGTPEQIARVLDVTAEWLDAHPRDVEVRRVYLGMIEQKGTPEQIARVLDATADWLATHSGDVEVRREYLGLIAQKGTPEQVAGALDATAEWLDAHRDNVEVRREYLGLVARNGTPAQVARVLDVTAAWLGSHPQDMRVLQAYMRIVENQDATAPVLAALRVVEDRLQLPEARLRWQLLGAYGMLLQCQKRLPEAEQCFLEALRLHKGDVAVRVRLAWCLYKQNRKPEALAELLHARYWAEHNTHYSVGGVLYELGHFSVLEGKIPQAKSWFTQAIIEDPNVYTNYWQLAQVAVLEQQFERAYSYLQQALARLPNNTNNRDRANIEKLRAWFEI